MFLSKTCVSILKVGIRVQSRQIKHRKLHKGDKQFFWFSINWTAYLKECPASVANTIHRMLELFLDKKILQYHYIHLIRQWYFTSWNFPKWFVIIEYIRMDFLFFSLTPIVSKDQRARPRQLLSSTIILHKEYLELFTWYFFPFP